MSIRTDWEDAVGKLREVFARMEGDGVAHLRRVRDLEDEVGKSHDIRVSLRDGIIHDLVGELRLEGYDIPCGEDGLPLGWTRPESQSLDEARLEDAIRDGDALARLSQELRTRKLRGDGSLGAVDAALAAIDGLTKERDKLREDQRADVARIRHLEGKVAELTARRDELTDLVGHEVQDVARERDELNLRVANSRSTIRRLADTLVSHGYIIQTDEDDCPVAWAPGADGVTSVLTVTGKARAKRDGACRERDEAQAETKRIAGALQNLMASSDQDWEDRNLGHDWRDAMEKAREALGVHARGC